MPRPPAFNQRRYRGRIRDNMRSAYNHLLNLVRYENKYLENPPTQYPQHLAPDSEYLNLTNCVAQLITWLHAKGPIP